MNRKRKMNAILDSRIKKQNAKLSKVVKPKYVSKAERERLALLALEEEQAGTQSDTELEKPLEE